MTLISQVYPCEYYYRVRKHGTTSDCVCICCFVLNQIAVLESYANWKATTLAAVFGTGALSPIIAPGRSAAPWQESLVTFGFSSVALKMIGAAILVLWGLRRGANHERLPSLSNQTNIALLRSSFR